MKRKRICRNLVGIFVILAVTYGGFVLAAVSPEEAAQLGKTLTLFGAEKAGNKEGTIPEYTGGLTTPPSNFKPGSGVRPDPFPDERPLFSINAQNMGQYADKLTDGTKVMMKKYPTFRIDVYKTRRTVAYPDFVLKATAKNAVKATTANGGLSVRDARAGVPFPIPKDGYEIMWNHFTSFRGRAADERLRCYVMDTSGRLILTMDYNTWQEFPYYDENPPSIDAGVYFKGRGFFNAPPRQAGQNIMYIQWLDTYTKGSTTTYQYLPGQRRVKLAPDCAFDTPAVTTAGAAIYDEYFGYSGSMERYDMKLIGKKEFYVIYNAYKALFMVKPEEVFKPNHWNPDLVRWELHRVWVVEATLKQGKRHIYPKRRFYLDEDSWAMVSCENYDAHGDIIKANFNFHVPFYDIPAAYQWYYIGYNMVSGIYHVDNWYGDIGWSRPVKPHPLSEYTPAAMVGEGVR